MTTLHAEILEDITLLPAKWQSPARYTELDVEVLPADSGKRPHTRPSSRSWATWGEVGSEDDYLHGVRFCELYRAERRSHLEEAELTAMYTGAYCTAFEVVAHIARKVGFQDPDILTDCASGLVDFCAREYDPDTSGRNHRIKTFRDYLKNIAYAYLRKHRDFLGFSRKMTGVGFATGSHRDLLTASAFASVDQPQRPSPITAGEEDSREVLDTFAPDCPGSPYDLDPLYASEWGSSFAEDSAQIMESVEESMADLEPLLDTPDTPENREAAPTTLSGWVDCAVRQIQSGQISTEALTVRAPAILEQLRSVTGARITDIAKRLIARIKAGCRIAATLLQVVRSTLLPDRHARTIEMIESVLQDRHNSKMAQGLEVVAEPDIPQLAVMVEQPSEQSPERFAEVPDSLLAAAAAEDLDLGLLIDTGDLRHGRIPPAKPRYVSVDYPPSEPVGTPPILDDDSPPVDHGPPVLEGVEMVFRERSQSADLCKSIPFNPGGLHVPRIPPTRSQQTGLALWG